MKWEGCGVKKNSKPPEIRKKELIDTAAELFAEKGYEAVSIRDILEKVHGAPGMFYYYFKWSAVKQLWRIWSTPFG